MTFIHDDGTERGSAPTEGTLADGRTVSGIQPDDLTLLAACGWYPVTDTPRPDDTATTTYDRSIDGTYTVVWTERPWTADEQAARAATVNRATLVDEAAAALTANAKFLALTSPTNAQTLAQVKALTRENTAIIRLLLNRLDTDEGT